MDDELTRARRALRAADPELDLARAYTESRARAEARAAVRGATGSGLHGQVPRPSGRADTGAGDWAAPWSDSGSDDWADTRDIEVLLRDPDTPGLVPAALRRAPSGRRGPVLAWAGAAAAAAAAVLVLSLAGTPEPGALPGSAPGTGASAAGTPRPGASPSPTTWRTPGEVVTLAGKAMSGASCGVKIRSTLGDQSIMRFDRVDEPDVAVPKPLLDQQPLPALQAASARVLLRLPGYDGTNQRLDDDLTIEELAGQTVARIRVTPSDDQVRGGDVTRVDVLVDTTTWLPRAQEIWATSDGGKQLRVHSDLSWSGCDEPSMAPTNDADRP
ncbi:hypothetical protein [Promicromonospora sp. MEB111]|uniref:hypothetical protein n=1 Tax=Promicromonospora sp. MEB111 TaxID=3040301 RepID=UPI00255116D8|nr:hypothetical protein [Promicromonospora sp. MEB111]